MMKFILVSRRPDGGTLDRTFYEWAVIHVALMLTTPTVTRVFKRYVQHYGIWDVPESQMLYPRAPERWETLADHWVETYDDLVASVTAPDYVTRMQPHRFTSSEFIIMLGESKTIYEKPDFKSGGTKLILWHRKADGLSQDAFNKAFHERRGPVVAETLKKFGLRKYVQTVPVGLDPALFKGTLFERGSVGRYAAIEEIWLESSDDLARLAADKAATAAIHATDAGLFAPGESFSLFMLERVAFDFVTKEKHRMASVQDAGSLEHALFAQEAIYKDALKRQTPA
jgi:hypothetical protein